MENSFQEILKSNHHAFLIKTLNREKIFLEIKNEISDIDNFFLNLKVLEIEKAREIMKIGNIKYDKTKFIVLSFYTATIETQNSLLKFLEEPPKNIKIILIVSQSTNLLSTIISRVYNISESLNKEEEKNNLTIKFLKTKKIDRMKMLEIKEILEAEDEYAKEFDDKERKDREISENFLLELEKEIYLEFLNKLKDKELLKNLNDIQDFKKYIKSTSSSPKTIFEYLALSVKEF